MKNIIWVFFLIPLISFSQSIQIDSFNGIRFGAEKDEAISTVKKLGASLVSFYPLEEVAYLSHYNFEGLNCSRAYLKFINNKFYEGILEIDVNPSNYNELYTRVKQALSKKYGYGKEYSWMAPPYYFNDGDEFNALLEQKGKFCHVWAKHKQVTSDDFIIMEIGADKVLRVVFQNHQFAVMATKRNLQMGASNNK